MEMILLTALGVGGATVVGSLLGFIFRGACEKYSGYITAYAAGLMLMAAISGLIIPSYEGCSTEGIFQSALGVCLGVAALIIIERFLPLPQGDGKLGAILFAIAIAVHNLPEGIAAGVALGAESDSATGVIVGITLHNLPEGMIVISPMLGAGVTPRQTFLYALAGGAAEVAGTFIGFFAVQASLAMLPFVLSFAGGTMLAVIAGEMIPECMSCKKRRATVWLVLGFITMMILGALV